MHIIPSLPSMPRSASLATELMERAARGDEDEWERHTLEVQCQKAARKIEDPRQPGQSTREERAAAAVQLISDGVRPEEAAGIVDSLTAASAGCPYTYQGGGLLDEQFVQKSTPPVRPLADVLADYRELARVVPDRRDALQAYHALQSELRETPEQARRYRELLAAGHRPGQALDVTRSVSELPASRQAETHAAIAADRSPEWGARTRMRLALAEATASQADAERALAAIESEPRRYPGRAFELGGSWLKWAAGELTRPGESSSQGVVRLLELSRKLVPFSRDPSGELFLLRAVHAGWPEQDLEARIDRLTSARLPRSCFATLCHKAHHHARAGESMEATLARLEGDWRKLEQAFGAELAPTALNAHLSMARGVEDILGPGQEWRARHGDEHLAGVLEMLPQRGDEELLARLEKSLFLTGDLRQLEQARQSLPMWAGSAAAALASDFDGWVAASRLGASSWDNDLAVRAARAGQAAGGDLLKELPRLGIGPEELARIQAAARPDERLPETLARVGLCYGQCLEASKQPEGLVKSLIYELVAEGLGDRMEAFPAVFKACAGMPVQEVRQSVFRLMEQQYDDQTVEEMRQSRYLTGTYGGLQALRERLEETRPQAVPPEEHYQTALAHLHQLRLHGTPPRECVERVLERMRSAPETGVAVGRVGQRFVVGGVPVRVAS